MRRYMLAVVDKWVSDGYMDPPLVFIVVDTEQANARVSVKYDNRFDAQQEADRLEAEGGK